MGRKATINRLAGVMVSAGRGPGDPGVAGMLRHLRLRPRTLLRAGARIEDKRGVDGPFCAELVRRIPERPRARFGNHSVRRSHTGRGFLERLYDRLRAGAVQVTQEQATEALGEQPEALVARAAGADPSALVTQTDAAGAPMTLEVSAPAEVRLMSQSPVPPAEPKE